MVLRHLIILCVLFFGLPLIGQSIPKNETTVNIRFIPDEENPAIYRLNCTTNSNDLFGTINFYDANNRLLLQLKEIEIAHDPGYHLIEILDFPKGEIRIEMYVDDVPYSQTFQL